MKQIIAGLAVVTAMTSCTSNANKEAEIQQAKQYTIDSMKNAAALEQAAARYNSNGKTTTVYRNYTTAPAPAASGSRDSHDRPGWSNKAKGAVIGGVVGAVTGAAVSKDKKGKGAVIGGVVGAAGGYGVGAILDKKKQ